MQNQPGRGALVPQSLGEAEASLPRVRIYKTYFVYISLRQEQTKPGST